MKKVKILVGSVVAGSSGQVNDDRQEVEFEGEFIASLIQYNTTANGAITDSRGVTQTLYQTPTILVVHVDSWSRWQGEPDVLHLEKITSEDLMPGGRFAALGQEANMSRPLTLEEALGVSQGED